MTMSQFVSSVYMRVLRCFFCDVLACCNSIFCNGV